VVVFNVHWALVLSAIWYGAEYGIYRVIYQYQPICQDP
jgi:hypothetical protein